MIGNFLNKRKKIELKFPLNNGGQEVGISEGGIEHFTGKLVESLCKEILQNSLDAKRDKERVIVKFELLKIDKKEIPEIEALKKTLRSSIEYWSENEKAIKVLKKGEKSITSEKITVLKISDFGTCGLTGAKKTRNSNFYNLVKSSGASSKGGQAGGSFGIGKFAPFACSFPRTVFYSTLDVDGNYAFQGVSRLVTHKINGKTTQGVGYIGNPEGNLPITEKNEIPSIFLRKETGTDINIIGFKGEKDWENSIIIASLNSFFESIYEGKLEIRVGNKIINKSNFQEICETFLKRKERTYEYFKCITESEGENKVVFKENFISGKVDYGEIELHLYKEIGFKKKVAYLRSTGMKIIDKDRFRTSLNFTGVLKLNGEKINSFIRSLETPSHDKLEVARHDDPKLAKKILDDLNKFVRTKISEFSKIEEEEELDVKGLSDYLPDSSKEEEILNYSLKNGAIKNLLIEKTTKKVKKKKLKQEELDECESENGEGENTGGVERGDGNTQVKTDTPNDTTEGAGETPKKSSLENLNQINLKKERAIIQDSLGKTYKIILESEKPRTVYIKLKAIYEDNGGEFVEIVKANSLNPEVRLEKNYIIVPLEVGKKEVIKVELKEEIYGSMEVITSEK